MIYKIIMDFTNLDDVIKLLSKRFNLIFVDNAIYICDKKYANTTISYIKKLLKNNNVFILKIDETNLANEPCSVVKWCRDNFVALDRQRYEIEQQDKLQNAWKALDRMEVVLKKKLEENN